MGEAETPGFILGASFLYLKTGTINNHFSDKNCKTFLLNSLQKTACPIPG
jgi:hypothetical protein